MSMDLDQQPFWKWREFLESNLLKKAITDKQNTSSRNHLSRGVFGMGALKTSRVQIKGLGRVTN